MLLALLLMAKPTLQLEWSAPSACPDRDWLRGEIERVHGTLVAGGAEGLVAHAAVRELRGRWQVDVETRLGDAVGHRRLSADTCPAGAKAAAVVISLALTHPPARPISEQPAPPLSAPPSVSAPSESIDEGAPPGHIKLVVAASATLRSGPLPDVVAGAAVTAGVWRNGLQLELSVFTPASKTIAAGRGRADLSMPLSGELAVSWAFLEDPMELDVLLAVEAGWARGRSLEVVMPGSGDTAWLAAEPGAAVRFSLGSGFWARIEGRAGLSLLRPRFQLDLGAGPQDLFQTPLFSGRAGLGIERIF